MTGYEYRTPRARLWWGDVAAWRAAANEIDRRRSSAPRNAALRAHAAALPLDLIAAEADPAALAAAIDLLKYGPPGLARPPRGARADAPQTSRIVALADRLEAIERAAELVEIAPGHNARAVFGRRADP
ncbi:MAG: hypothetical protein AAGE83_02675 [Pseudomonadota bacterium]